MELDDAHKIESDSDEVASISGSGEESVASSTSLSSSSSVSSSSSPSSSSSSSSPPPSPTIPEQHPTKDIGEAAVQASNIAPAGAPSRKAPNRFAKRTRGADEEPPGVCRQKRKYSDSDNSYEPFREKPYDKAVTPIDWDEHLDQDCAKRLLFSSLGIDQISSLICLANTLASTEDPDPLRENYCNQTSDFQDPCRSNPLIGLESSPLPLSYLDYFAARSEKSTEFANKLCKTFGTSALVAIGMFLEEMLTASLLPLAGLHVLRCRELETKSDDYTGNNGSTDMIHPIDGSRITRDVTTKDNSDNAFDEWNLPPEEALFKLLQQGLVPSGGISLVQEPTRFAAAAADEASRPARERCGESIANWLNAQQLNHTLVENNSELFTLFVAGGIPRSITDAMRKRASTNS